MKILIVNAGSSSLKYQVMDWERHQVLAKGLVGRIGIEGGSITHKTHDGRTMEIKAPMKDHVDGIRHMLACLTDKDNGVLSSMAEISAVGHRVLHGGKEFSASVIIDEQVKEAIRRCIPLGPLHNPANLMGIEACEKVMPGVPQVAVFDTAFHQTMPPKAYMYGVPKKYESSIGLRRYGFHGTSHRYVSRRVCDFLGVNPVGKKIIVAHLGNGSSLSAVVDGKCVDTSMGLTPLEGVLMGTRSGSCDPAVVQFIANSEHKSVDEVLNLMNKESGLLGMAGASDMRDIDAMADQGNEDALLARDILDYGILKYIGSYTAAMNGVDILVFTAGIGENNFDLRSRVCRQLGFLGVVLDEEKNATCANPTLSEMVISKPESRVTVVVIPTNEELMIAQDTVELVTHQAK